MTDSDLLWQFYLNGLDIQLRIPEVQDIITGIVSDAVSAQVATDADALTAAVAAQAATDATALTAAVAAQAATDADILAAYEAAHP